MSGSPMEDVIVGSALEARHGSSRFRLLGRLRRDSVANASQIVTLDRAGLTERVSRLSQAKLQLVLAGIDIVLGRP